MHLSLAEAARLLGKSERQVRSGRAQVFVGVL